MPRGAKAGYFESKEITLSEPIENRFVGAVRGASSSDARRYKSIEPRWPVTKAELSSDIMRPVVADKRDAGLERAANVLGTVEATPGRELGPSGELM